MGKPFAEDLPPDPNDTWVRRLRFPAVSGKTSALVLIVCLGVTGLIVIPLAGYFRLPRWLRVEALLVVWWLVWAAALAKLLYSGRRVSDDHTLVAPRNWFGRLFSGQRGSGGSQGSGGSWLFWDDPFPGDIEGAQRSWVSSSRSSWR